MKATNKDNAQKMISAKIAKKLVELANKYVVPCININMPGRYSASQLYDEKDAFGRKLCYSFDKYKCAQIMPADNEFCVSVNASDFTAEEMAILGYEPKFRLQIKPDNIFYAISKFEHLAGLRSTDRAKFIIGEPETLYETERAKVVIYDNEKQKIVTKTKTLTIISDTQAVYKQDKETITLCLKINGKWFAVHSLPMAAYDLDAIAEIVLKRYTIYNIRKGVKATANSQVCNKFVEFCRIIQSELDAMDKLNAEASVTQKADNVVADSESNANVATESKANAETSDSTGNDTANEPKEKQQQSDADAPPKDSGTPKNQCERKIADLSEFCGCGDKRYHPSGENRNMGIYCGKNEGLPANARGSPQSAAINKHFLQLKTNI